MEPLNGGYLVEVLDVSELTNPIPGGSRWRHDMKNQIGIILGFSELLLGELGDDSRLRHDVQEIYTAALRAMDLLANGDSLTNGDSPEAAHHAE